MNTEKHGTKFKRSVSTDRMNPYPPFHRYGLPLTETCPVNHALAFSVTAIYNQMYH